MFWNFLRSRRTLKARRRVARSVKPTFRPELEALELKLLLSNHVWTGHGSDDHWSNDANWDTGQPGPGDTAVFNGGVSTVDPAFGGTIGGLVLNGGVLRLGRDLTLTGSSTWSTGDINAGSSAPTSLTNNGTLTLVTNGLRGLSGLLTNNGEIDYNGSGGGLYMNDTADLENAGTFVFEGTDSEMWNNGAHSTFTNTGTVIQSGTGTGLLGVAIFNNTGVVDVQSGALNLLPASGSTTGGTFMMDVAEARLNFGNGTQTLAGATFTGDGRAQVVGGTVILSTDVSAQNFGMTGGTLQVNPGVTLTVTGDYTQTGGALEYDIAGPSSYGRILVAGRAALGGYLRVRFLNGYTPQVGDSFQVLTYGSRSGDFGDDFPQLDGRHLQEAFDPPGDPDVPGSLSIETVQGP
jgi:hypothetical protein